MDTTPSWGRASAREGIITNPLSSTTTSAPSTIPFIFTNSWPTPRAHDSRLRGRGRSARHADRRRYAGDVLAAPADGIRRRTRHETIPRLPEEAAGFRADRACPASTARTPHLEVSASTLCASRSRSSASPLRLERTPKHHYSQGKGSSLAGTDPAIRLALRSWPRRGRRGCHSVRSALRTPPKRYAPSSRRRAMRRRRGAAAIGCPLCLRGPGTPPPAVSPDGEASRDPIVTTLIHQRVRLEEHGSQRLFRAARRLPRYPRARHGTRPRFYDGRNRGPDAEDGAVVAGEENLAAFSGGRSRTSLGSPAALRLIQRTPRSAAARR